VKYRLLWDPDAFRKLLKQWNAAGKPQAATVAFDAIEAELGTDAHERGESRDGNRRILLVPPLGLIFEVRQDIGEITILDAWIIPVRRE
jgi:hypothetical protein